uniref:Peptidase aspartic putative domain-containing protein n=1 Tax=Clytia hemisphaerica TaxID=252671 RepID=A0A7M6DQR2_9CNID
LFESYDSAISSIQMYITDAKQTKRDQREFVENSSKEAKSKSIEFSIKNVDHSLKLIESQLSIDFNEVTDTVVQSASKDIPDITKSMEKIAIELKVLIRDTTGTTKEPSVTMLQQKYSRLITSLQTFSTNVKKQLADREIDKLSTFKDSILKIKRQKFSGFDSKLDIYSFQTEFEKLHKRHTPRCYMPDLLRNNYLEDPALSIVKAETNIDEIWKRLKSSFGNTNILLNNKLQELSSLENIWRLKNPSKIAEALTKIISLMKDLMSLSEQHNIEAKLYNSDGIQRLYKLIGDSRTTRWFESICDQDLEGKELWFQLIEFLERDLKVQQQKQLLTSLDTDKPPRGQHSHPSIRDPSIPIPDDQTQCAICGSKDHPTTIGPKGNKLIQYFVCKEFADMSPSERFSILKRKHLCHQCLFPGAHVDTGKHQEGKCQRQFICRHKDHDNFTIKKHVLVCEEHKRDQENVNQLERFKQRCISKRNNMPEFSKNISNFIAISSFQTRSPKDSVDESAIFQFQEVTINHKPYLIFYDSGCDDFIVRTSSVKSLDAELQCQIPINLGGVGGVTTPIRTNVYSVKIPTHDGSDATFVGISLDKITSTFPTYHLNGQVEHDVHEAYKKVGGDPSQLPKLPPTIGGNVDLMIGIRYLRYFPKFVFQMPSGLTIYQSIFRSSCGSRGVIGGPHQLFTMINNEFHRTGKSDFISKQFRLYQTGYQLNPDVPLLCTTRTYQVSNNSYPGQQSTFDIAESAGSKVTYRCTKCRSCVDCKSNGSIEATSIREEVEQELINKSIIVKSDEQVTIATLPFIQDPITRLVPNRSRALKVYNQQVSKLNRHPEDKSDVLESERKLQRLGHVDYVNNLPKDQQDQLSSNAIQNYIPWRAVWKLSSLTTPCRIVFDASQPTSSGYSLNSILAKGTNGMNKLVEILIRWYTHRSAFHTDVTKMYNSVKLCSDYWCYQRYLWHDTLDINQPPEEKVIKTLIYGVRSSGNQSERGIRQTSSLSKEEFNDQTSKQRADQMEIALSRGGFGLKGFTFSGDDPPASLTKDGESIGVGGLIWYPKSDQIAIDVTELNFAKKHRGKKPTIQVGVIPSKLTRRHCVSKVGEIFDITGKLTPITASFKLDLRSLVDLGLSWDDAIPDNLRPIWEDNFTMMQEIKNIRYQRTIVPPDAVNLNINTVDFGDASKQMAAVAIYARMLRKNGEYSSQLIFSRSKVISPTTQPRAELIAAVLNAHTGEVVRRALKSKHDGSIKLTDSTINLHWISNDEITLKPFVRNRIIEIKRFTSSENWYYINTKQMLADLPRRRGCKLFDINNSSRWINGDSWMTTDVKDFPIKKLNKDVHPIPTIIN